MCFFGCFVEVCYVVLMLLLFNVFSDEEVVDFVCCIDECLGCCSL